MTIYKDYNSNFLGEAPKYKEEKDILNYFLYVFEFNWTLPAFEQYQANIREHFEFELNKILNTNKELSNEKQWWGLILIALRDISIEAEFHYAVEIINKIFKSIKITSEDSLKESANKINSALFSEIPDVLWIRPLELVALNSDALTNDNAMNYLLENTEAIKKIFTKNLTQKDVNMEYMNNLLINGKKFDLKYADFWSIYFEVFILYFISIYDFLQYSDKLNHKEQIEHIAELLKKTNLVFFVASIKNKIKIDKVNNEVTELVVPFMQKDNENI
ncbi:MAG: hypothetical protein K0R54_95 [Clostridiaceae bacterium]|jgi:hypothetical protein|nr:hypothetical protein [Clostridiaceae bacterium]